MATKPATNVAPRSATLNGSFNGNGDGTEFFFEIGHGPAGVYTETTPTLDAGEPTGAAPLTAPVSNLELETTYHYRVVAKNGTGESKGFDQAFTTPPAVASLTTEPASEIGHETVTLNAKFNGDGQATKYFFEYGPSTTYGLRSSADPQDAEIKTGPTSIASAITTYYGYKTYHYRVVAENDFGTTYGKDRTFTTGPAPKPLVSGIAVEELTPTTAKVSAIVAPNRADASWLFEWGEPTVDYGKTTEGEPILPRDDDGVLPDHGDPHRARTGNRLPLAGGGFQLHRSDARGRPDLQDPVGSDHRRHQRPPPSPRPARGSPPGSSPTKARPASTSSSARPPLTDSRPRTRSAPILWRGRRQST